jgi:hypothetical protein
VSGQGRLLRLTEPRSASVAAMPRYAIAPIGNRQSV